MPVVLPGDVVRLPSSSSSSSSSAIRLGPGLLYPNEESRTSQSGVLLATRAGVLGKVNEKGKARDVGGSTTRKAQGWWIESSSRRYHPNPADPVVAQITGKNADFYTLSLFNSPHPATLPVLSFEGATKRHRPNLKIGAVVYAVVAGGSGNDGIETEVSCVDATTGKANGMGELDAKEGYSGVISVSLGLAKSLLHPSHPLLPLLSQHFAFESATGVNGFVWLRVSEARHFVAAKLVLEAADQQGLEGLDGVDDGEDASLEQQKSSSPSRPDPRILSRPEKEAGEWGKKLSVSWGTHLDAKEVKRLVQKVLA